MKAPPAFIFPEKRQKSPSDAKQSTLEDVIKLESYLCPFCLVPEDFIDFVLIREEAWHGRSDVRIDVQ